MPFLAQRLGIGPDDRLAEPGATWAKAIVITSLVIGLTFVALEGGVCDDATTAGAAKAIGVPGAVERSNVPAGGGLTTS